MSFERDLQSKVSEGMSARQLAAADKAAREERQEEELLKARRGPSENEIARRNKQEQDIAVKQRSVAELIRRDARSTAAALVGEGMVPSDLVIDSGMAYVKVGRYLLTPWTKKYDTKHMELRHDFWTLGVHYNNASVNVQTAYHHADYTTTRYRATIGIGLDAGGEILLLRPSINPGNNIRFSDLYHFLSVSSNEHIYFESQGVATDSLIAPITAITNESMIDEEPVLLGWRKHLVEFAGAIANGDKYRPFRIDSDADLSAPPPSDIRFF